MAGHVSTHFDRTAASYDAERRRLIPGFDAFYGAAIEAVGPLAPGAAVLDIGAGTGLFSALVSAHWPETHFTLTDLAPAMLAEAEARFRSMGVEAPEIVVIDTATGLPEGPFDAVISALSIHHLTDAEKRETFARIAARLKPGGAFVNAEQVAGPTPAETHAYAEMWQREIRELGASDEAIAAAEERMMHDQCAPVADQLDWMRAAGLRDVACVWQRGQFAVLSGRSGGPRQPA
ncbi:methyltransferase domain-containing protein [Rhodobacteraceae bacterium NNCM2]|nr:methyltransferase domain-containing protein [Coraliihabitans acroporae]